ncbi:MAG: hypothetical protein KJ047_12595, partial [Anaerolineae bacterium]|nr:hypothetical protein [Anaerolineae bacterium]
LGQHVNPVAQPVARFLVEHKLLRHFTFSSFQLFVNDSGQRATGRHARSNSLLRRTSKALSTHYR